MLRNFQIQGDEYFPLLSARKTKATTLIKRFIDLQDDDELLPNKYGDDFASDVSSFKKEIEKQVNSLKKYKKFLEQTI